MANPITITTPLPPPHWALLERQLLRDQSDAVEAFFNHYFDERGYLMCVPRWGGNDGPDDAAEKIATVGDANKYIEDHKG